MMLDELPAHPGRVLRNQLRGRSVFELAAEVGIDAKELQQILNEEVGITREMCVGLAKAFGTTQDFWWQMQVRYNRWRESHKGKV